MSRQPAALITGASGQDGSLLAELLLDRGYRVWGMVRNRHKLGHAAKLAERVELCVGDLLEPRTLAGAVARIKPDELYHLASPLFIPDSWLRPAETMAATAVASAALLEAVCKSSPQTRVFIASSSFIFGSDPFESPQNERTPPNPDNPYGIGKLAAQRLAAALRERHGIFVVCGILYNHESERRPEQFVARKITRGAARIKLGLADRLELGDLEAARDWCSARDVVEGIWLSLQHEEPGDYVFASGNAHTVRELAELAFGQLGLCADDHVIVKPELVRQRERALLVGDPSLAERVLGWRRQWSFEELVRSMVDADLDELQRQRAKTGLA